MPLRILQEVQVAEKVDVPRARILPGDSQCGHDPVGTLTDAPERCRIGIVDDVPLGDVSAQRRRSERPWGFGLLLRTDQGTYPKASRIKLLDDMSSDITGGSRDNDRLAHKNLIIPVPTGP